MNLESQTIIDCKFWTSRKCECSLVRKLAGDSFITMLTTLFSIDIISLLHTDISTNKIFGFLFVSISCCAFLGYAPKIRKETIKNSNFCVSLSIFARSTLRGASQKLFQCAIIFPAADYWLEMAPGWVTLLRLYFTKSLIHPIAKSTID